jgi:hypothetical protein
VEHLEATHFRLYQRYRAARPDTPILFVSRPDLRRGEEDIARQKTIRKTYQIARKNGDTRVYFLNGGSFFTADRDICTVDGTHPNDLGFYRMAKKLYQKMGQIAPELL